MDKQSLGYYLDALAAQDPGQILDLPSPLPRDFVLMALAKKLDLEDAPPLIRGSLAGCDFPFVANLFANRARIAEMLGCNGPADISPHWSQVERTLIAPRLVADGPVQQVEEANNPDLSGYPWMQYYPTDAGRYISSSIVVVKDPVTGVSNLSYHRMQFKQGNRFGISLHSRQHLFHYFQQAEREGRPLDVAIIIGAHPAVYLAAAAKPALEVNEYDIAGAILGEPLKLVQGKTVDVAYPAEAEIVLEGQILPTVREPEGPFGEFTGYSTSRSTENVFVCSALYRRAQPIYLVTVPGSAKDHLYLARVAREAAVFQRLKERIPWVKEIAYPQSGVNFHAYLSLVDPHPAGIAKQALTLLMGLDHYVKLAVAVDEDIDINQDAAVLWAISTRCQMTRDLFTIPKSFIISLDPSSENNTSDKIGIDATMTPEMRDEVVILSAEPQHQAAADALLKEARGR